MNKKSKHQFHIFTNKDICPVFSANSKRGLIGILKAIIDNNMYDISDDPITIWDQETFERQSGLRKKRLRKKTGYS